MDLTEDCITQLSFSGHGIPFHLSQRCIFMYIFFFETLMTLLRVLYDSLYLIGSLLKLSLYGL